MDTQMVTRLLRRMGDGDSAAAESLYGLVYDDLHQRAARLMGRGSGHTLQPTAIVHEAWLKLSDGDVDWADRSHFLAVACRAMRMVLTDHARGRSAQKRGGDHQRQMLDAALLPFEERAIDLAELDDALSELARMDPILAKIVELRFFGGLTIEDTAKVLGASESTIERGWRTARAWLRTELADDAADDA